jgi:hypothetical protein
VERAARRGASDQEGRCDQEQEEEVRRAFIARVLDDRCHGISSVVFSGLLALEVRWVRADRGT